MLQVVTLNKFSRDWTHDCAPLNALSQKHVDALGFDYFVYSKEEKCWPDLHKKAANAAISEIERLIEVVENLGSEVTFYLVPAGWAFPYQNTNGRKNNSYYAFSDVLSVTNQPLFDYLSGSFPEEKFISLEEVILPWVSACDNCVDLFYFADDGHWTPHTHNLLHAYFDEKFQDNL